MARYTSTPGVLNLSQAAAKKKLGAAGLKLEVSGQAYSETYPRGTVMETDPEAGDRVLKDGTIEAVISKGPERHKVPKAVGTTLNRAQDMLDASHLEFGQATKRYHPKVKKGRVISMSPKPGTPLKRGTAVNLVVSQGPKPIEVPDFTGGRAETAVQRLEKLGFDVDTTEEYDDDVAAGMVISQDPSSGTRFKGDTIELLVSRGPEMVEVPRVRGRRLTVVRKELKAAGFKIRTVKADYYIGAGYVLKSSPKAGSKVRKGSTITITVV